MCCQAVITSRYFTHHKMNGFNFLFIQQAFSQRGVVLQSLTRDVRGDRGMSAPGTELLLQP